MNERTCVPFHFGPTPRALFGWYHPAIQRASRGVGVVLCNPIGDDYLRAHRTIRHLAERLAHAGFSVLRFDFHGTGDSTGDESDPERVQTWLQDIDFAIEALRRRSRAGSIALAGLRLGATLAMAAASRRGDIGQVVLWNPFVAGRAYVAETLRQHRMQTILDPKGFGLRNPEGTTGGAEALGFFLSDPTIAELKGLDLMREPKAPPKDVLLISPGDGPMEQALLTRLRSQGAATDFRQLAHKFLTMIPHESTLPLQELDEITAWLSHKHATTRDLSPPLPQPLREEESHLNERPLLFGKDQSIFAIAANPRKPRSKSKRPGIIIVNAGTTHRIGPHRFYVRLARAWQDLGFHVLRLDLCGIGDSVAESNTIENVCYPRRALSDVEAAMELMSERHSIERFIIVGLCSGADIAFQTAIHNRNISGVVMMNPRTFCVHDLEKVEMYDRAQYFQNSLTRKNSWLKLFRGEVDLQRKLRGLIPDFMELATRKLEETQKTITDRLARRSVDTAANTVPAHLRAMASRGVDTLLVVSAHDPGVDYVDIHFRQDMKQLEAVPGFRRADFPGTDHTFTSLYAQRIIAETITEHLKRNHPPS